MANTDAPKTPQEQFRDHLKAQGITLKEWSEHRGFDPEYCSRVLCGLVKGNRGLGHKIAVAMGLKQDVNATVITDQMTSEEK
ncbi:MULTISPECIES: DNA-binding protein [unclassified Acinetobacter]|uniref:DNA-binding protein n=1 Tax=unclassified Acinetobacter TaxID=196816 RepID=UPI0035BAA292